METLIQEIDVFVRDFVRGENNQLIFTRAYYDRSETPINKPLFTLDSKGELLLHTHDLAYIDLAETEKADQLIDAYIETCKEELETYNLAVLNGDHDYLSIFEHSDLYGAQVFHADYTLEARRSKYIDMKSFTSETGIDLGLAGEIQDGLYCVTGQNTLIEMTAYHLDDCSYYTVELLQGKNDHCIYNPSDIDKALFEESENFYSFFNDVYQLDVFTDYDKALNRYFELIKVHNHFH